MKRKILINADRGIGDQLCFEPTVRFALKHCSAAEIIVRTDYPEFFRHLNVDLIKDSIMNQANGPQIFYIHCIDYPSIMNLGVQLLREDRRIKFQANKIAPIGEVVIHAGRNDSLPLKNIPSFFWNELIHELVARKCNPILIGAENGSVGTMEIDASDCHDFRNTLDLEESAYTLQNSKVVICNDSSAYHMAAAGNAQIFLLTTWKDFGFLEHWRPENPVVNLSKGGVYLIPESNLGKPLFFDNEWLPNPKIVVENIWRAIGRE